jgi:hypothetical protein
MLLWLMLMLVGEGGGGSPAPDVGGTFARRRIGAFIKRGGVGRLRRGS